MNMYELELQRSMTNEQRLSFQSEFNSRRKDSTVGVLLALFLGGFGAHRFYLGNNGLGILYLLFFWTVIPALIAFVECFFMPGRVERWNNDLASQIAAKVQLLYSKPAVPVSGSADVVYCTKCGTRLSAESRFCSSCGVAAGAASGT